MVRLTENPFSMCGRETVVKNKLLISAERDYYEEENFICSIRINIVFWNDWMYCTMGKKCN